MAWSVLKATMQREIHQRMVDSSKKKSNAISNLSICVVAGEASGDAQGALVVQALKQKLPQAQFWGSAGPLLRAQGVEALISVEELAVFGFVEIATHYPKIAQCYKKLLAEITRRRPSAVILIDYPGFNLKLIQEVYPLGITTLYHIPPKAWSHGENRSDILRDNAYLVTSILPFEVPFFQKRHVPIQFIGNPLKDQVDEYIARHDNQKQDHQIGIIPGSRKSEIQRVLPTLIQAFIQLHEMENRVHACLPVAQTLPLEFVQQIVFDTAQAKGVSRDWIQKHITISFGNAHEVMSRSCYAWVCSGTATLETAFFSTPMSSFYKLNPMTYCLAKWAIKGIRYITLVNLCANKRVIPEFIQAEMTVENLTNHAFQILTDFQARDQMVLDFKQIQNQFPNGSAERAADQMINCILKYQGLSVSEKFHLRAKSLAEEF